MPEQPWRSYTEEELRNSPELRKKVFWRMLQALERRGDCASVFHRLAQVLFGDFLEY